MSNFHRVTHIFKLIISRSRFCNKKGLFCDLNVFMGFGTFNQQFSNFALNKNSLALLLNGTHEAEPEPIEEPSDDAGE